MAIYGFFATNTTPDVKTHGPLAAALAAKAQVLGDLPTAIYTGDHRAVAQLVTTLDAGDTLIVPGLHHLGQSMLDVTKALKLLCERGVRLLTLQTAGGGLDLVPEAGEAFLKVLCLARETQRELRSQQARETARARKAAGLAYCRPPMGKRIIERDGAKLLVWDQAELRRIAEVARRLPIEGVETVAKDFWRREIRDSRGRLWGKQEPKPFSRHRSPFQSFFRAHRTFWRLYWAGELPEPYAAIAKALEEPKGFREVPRPKAWTRGGTAKRDKERADRRAQNKAKRLA